MKITVEGRTKNVRRGIRLIELAEKCRDLKAAPIILALVNGELRELYHEVPDGADVRFITTAEAAGRDTYLRSCSMLFYAALYQVAGRGNIDRAVLHFTVSGGYYYTIEGNVTVDEALVAKIEKKMREMAAEHHFFNKRQLRTAEAIRLFERSGFSDKAALFETRVASTVNIYNLDGYEDYNYGYMAPHTSSLTHFKLMPYHDGILMLLPDRMHPNSPAPFKAEEQLFAAQWEGETWAASLGIDTIGRLNSRIIAGNAREVILIAEAKQEAKIAQIASEIKQRESVRFILIAGPSSSGKTTFSQRLLVQLEAQGLKPHYVGVDNYFIPRELLPTDEHGKKDFESLSAIDVEYFNHDMEALLRGETIKMPTYNFVTGKREFRGETISMGEGDVLIIEGIHCLNDELTYSLPVESKYKIYISALSQLNVDEHNRVASRDGRLVRRIIRDHKTRGYSASQTIMMWDMVQNGEERFIFPFQETADVFFNSALPYELAVMKSYVQPLLFSVGNEDPARHEARRLLKFLDYFLPLPAEDVPTNSILREFIGGGCFRL